MNDIERAIKQFERWEKSGWIKGEVPNTYMLILAKKALEKQLGSWIPVGERLPEEVGFYIFQLNDERIHEYYYANESLYGDCDGDEPIDKMAVNLNDVIAWQSLPEPYKEVGNE